MVIKFLGSEEFSKEDYNKSHEMAVGFFSEDWGEGYIPPEKITYKVLKEDYPNSFIIIKYGPKVIGHVLVFPCNSLFMNKFLSKEISELEMFNFIKKNITEEDFDCIYLASAFVLPGYRGRGLASKAFSLVIKRLCSAGQKKKVPLFYEALTKEGNRLSKKLGNELGFEIKGLVNLE